LQRLDLAKNKIGDDGGKAFAESQTLTSLKYVDLFGNGISQETQEIIKESLNFKNLQHLVLE
jgi:Ran GTPase-activating protein (RanGAP) involved in mRNA processing and transport